MQYWNKSLITGTYCIISDFSFSTVFRLFSAEVRVLLSLSSWRRASLSCSWRRAMLIESEKMNSGNHVDIMTWTHFHITGPLWGESISHQWFPLTKGLWCGACYSLVNAVEQMVKLLVIWDTLKLMWHHHYNIQACGFETSQDWW